MECKSFELEWFRANLVIDGCGTAQVDVEACVDDLPPINHDASKDKSSTGKEIMEKVEDDYKVEGILNDLLQHKPTSISGVYTNVKNIDVLELGGCKFPVTRMRFSDKPFHFMRFWSFNRRELVRRFNAGTARIEGILPKDPDF